MYNNDDIISEVRDQAIQIEQLESTITTLTTKIDILLDSDLAIKSWLKRNQEMLEELTNSVEPSEVKVIKKEKIIEDLKTSSQYKQYPKCVRRIANALNNDCNVKFITEDTTSRDIMRMPNIGRKTFNVFANFLQDNYNLTIKDKLAISYSPAEMLGFEGTANALENLTIRKNV